MALEISLEKQDGAVWGFRLTGGAEYDVPLTVVKVTENSIAEQAGLQVDDIIVRVNETLTINLSHPEAHDLLLAAGNNLTLAIRRGEPPCFTTQEDENNAEVCSIMQHLNENDENSSQINNTVHFDLANVVEEKSTEEINTIQTKHISQEQEIAISVSENTETKVEERKWSTFLQKPRNPKPVKIDPKTTPQAPPYRVVIVKQKKKNPEDAKTQSTVSGNILDENKTESIEISQETNVTDTGEETTYRAEITQEENIEVELEENEDIQNETEKVQENEGNEEDTQEADENANFSVAEEEILDKSIEEKLAEVQRQLEALAHLPSTIQSTINAVTQQLASIVSIKKPETNTEENQETENEETEEVEETIVDETCISINEDQEVEAVPEDNEEEPEELQEEATEIVEPEETEEEKEAKRIQQELLEKQQKDLEEFKQRHLEQRPLKPIDRPIILPGGRRWSQPDDACPAIRHPKMSDEKIANTIETFSEVLIGKAKGLTNGIKRGRGPTPKKISTVGILDSALVLLFPQRQSQETKINFLKYQPPPKKLDYLEKSEVYRLVHDLEPPVRGISNRASKILAEQDYYKKEEPV